MRIFLTDRSTCSLFMADGAGQSDFLRLARGLWKKQDFHDESLHGQLYVHIGYCQERCSFCAYPSRILRRNEDLDNLLEMLASRNDLVQAAVSRPCL